MVLTSALLLVAAPALQEPRTPTLVTDTVPPLQWQLELATTGDHVVSTWRASGSDSLYLTLSDGRGLAWSAPVELDVTPGTAGVVRHSLAALGDTAWIAWDDTRLHLGSTFSEPQSAPFLRPIDLTGGSLGAEVALPVMGPIDDTETTVMAIEAVEVAGEVHVHVLLYSETFSDGNRRLILTSSHDGGATFPFTEVVATGLFYYQETAALVVEGETLHVAFEGGDTILGPLQVRYQRSSDGGESLDFSPTQVLFDGAELGLVTLLAAATNDRLVVTWTDDEVISDEPFNIASRARAVVSDDGGDSFTAAALLDEVASPYLRLRIEGALVEPASGNTTVAWGETNIDGGNYTIYYSASPDAGASWQPSGILMNGMGSGFSGLLGDSQGRGRVVLVRAFNDPLGFPAFDRTLAAVSYDGGLQFEPAFVLGAFGNSAHAAVYNERYQNVVALMRSQPGSALTAGGFRPQTLNIDGYQAGPATIQASFERFDDGSQSVWLVASDALGDLPLPFGDGRNLGLAATPLLIDTISTPAVFLVDVDADGAATLPPLNTSIPVGLTLHFAALGFDLATLGFGDISDVRTEQP
ncbi:MAG: sialidase family protein [Planctomycetota bacterium]